MTWDKVTGGPEVFVEIEKYDKDLLSDQLVKFYAATGPIRIAKPRGRAIVWFLKIDLKERFPHAEVDLLAVPRDKNFLWRLVTDSSERKKLLVFLGL